VAALVGKKNTHYPDMGRKKLKHATLNLNCSERRQNKGKPPVPVNSVWNVFGSVFIEMSELPKIRRSTNLEEKPIKTFHLVGGILGDQFPVLFGKVQKNVTAFKDRDGFP
jgi:hypothetical protein